MKNPLEKSKKDLNYIIFTHGCDGGSVAYKLQNEGCNVVLAQFQDKSEFLDDKESKEWKKELSDMSKEEKDEHKESERRRLSIYDGILNKLPAEEVLKDMESIENKDDYFIWFDLNSYGVVAEKVQKMGFTKGLFPSVDDLDMEEDRSLAKEFVRENYKDITVGEEHDFKKIEDAIKFLEETEKIWVLKGNDDGAKTKVPMTNDPEKARFILTDLLESHQEDYERGGFILEEKIVDGYEMTPEAIFYDGELIMTTVDIENKPKEAGNIGIQLGCAQNLVFKTEFDSKINKIAFPEAVHKIAKKHKGLFVWDAGLIMKDGKFYFTEFCSQRFGYDSLFTEIEMTGSANKFFTDISEGRNPLKYAFGAAVRGLNEHRGGSLDRRVLEGIPMQSGDGFEDSTWIYEIKAEDDKLVCTGNNWDLVVFTGAGNTIEKAVDLAYEAADSFIFDDIAYRPKFDFLSKDYVSAIMNRYEAGMKKGLFSKFNKII